MRLVCIQKARGSSPLRSIAGQRPIGIFRTAHADSTGFSSDAVCRELEPPVRPLGGRRPWPGSCSRTSQAPRCAAVLLPPATSAIGTGRWPPRPARRPAGPASGTASNSASCAGDSLHFAPPAGSQRPPPPVRRHSRHAEPPRGGQPAATGIPHDSAVAPCAPGCQRETRQGQ